MYDAKRQYHHVPRGKTRAQPRTKRQNDSATTYQDWLGGKTTAQPRTERQNNSTTRCQNQNDRTITHEQNGHKKNSDCGILWCLAIQRAFSGQQHLLRTPVSVRDYDYDEWPRNKTANWRKSDTGYCNFAWMQGRLVLIRLNRMRSILSECMDLATVWNRKRPRALAQQGS